MHILPCRKGDLCRKSSVISCTLNHIHRWKYLGNLPVCYALGACFYMKDKWWDTGGEVERLYHPKANYLTGTAHPKVVFLPPHVTTISYLFFYLLKNDIIFFPIIVVFNVVEYPGKKKKKKTFNSTSLPFFLNSKKKKPVLCWQT